MKRAFLFSFLIFQCLLTAYGQQETYFYKIQEIANRERLYTNLLIRLDSLKKTRRPNDSFVKIFFDRDVDFGFTHRRIIIALNSTHYEINLLVKQDTICYCSTSFFDEYQSNSYFDYFNEKHSKRKVDTIRALRFLSFRNSFYHSKKSLNDLKRELERHRNYAFYCGDGLTSKQNDAVLLDSIVQRQDIKELTNMLSSINCETQQYGIYGLDELRKKGLNIPAFVDKITEYIKKRNSDLVTCAADIYPVIAKAYN